MDKHTLTDEQIWQSFYQNLIREDEEHVNSCNTQLWETVEQHTRLSTDKPQPNEVTVYHMDPNDMEAYLIEKYGIKKLRESRSSEDSTKFKSLSEDLIEYNRKRGGFGG